MSMVAWMCVGWASVSSPWNTETPAPHQNRPRADTRLQKYAALPYP